METRYLFGVVATFVGGPLLFAMMIGLAAATVPDAPQAMPVTVGHPVAITAAGTNAAADASPVAAQPAPATAAIATRARTLPGLASVGLERAGNETAATETGDAPLPSGFFHKLGYAGSTDDAYANALPESDFALLDGGLALDGPATASAFAALPEVNTDLLLLTGFAPGIGAAGGSAGDPPVFAATEQMQFVSGVPEPASWVSFIVGLGLIGFNLRDRHRMRQVVC